MLFENLVEIIEKTAPLQAAAPWDRSGLQVAASRKKVSRLAVFLDATPQTVALALQDGADCLLSHHPLALKPGLPNVLDGYHEVLRLLMKADVPLYAAHTSLDVNMDGPAGWLGRELRLQRPLPLEPASGQPWSGLILGFGQVGDLPAPVPFCALAARVLELAGIESANLCGMEPAMPVDRVAYCPGSGSSLIEKARESGCQLFITGDIKYHAALDAGIAVLDVGHHSLEEEMMRRFALSLRNQLQELEVFFVPSTSPFKKISRNLQERGNERSYL